MSRRPLTKKHIHRPQPVQPRQPKKLVRPPKRKLPAQYRRS
jgi:hypothetical protein